MSNLHHRHPESEWFLAYVDGELPGRQSRRVERHLEACWQCRAELEKVQSSVSTCVRYRQQVLAACLPEPPQAWGRLDFSVVDAEFASRSVFARLGGWLWPRGARLRWALSGALALTLTAVILYQLRETPKVEAAVLLQKAVAASASRTHTARRVRIKTATRQWIRPIGGSAIRPSAGEKEIAQLFESARYDWNDPLSAKAYAAWHDALAAKRDEVASSDPEVYSIRTTTADSPLTSATLKLRKADLAPVEGRFEFGDHEWVELTESVDQLTPPGSTIAGTTGGTPRQPGVPPVPSPRVAQGPDESVNEELQVAAALHQIHADLGDPLEIHREGGDVVVTGLGIGAQRQQEIHNALDRLPHVVVRFSDPDFPASTPAQSEPGTARDAASAERPIYTARMEQRLGGRPQFERFSGQLLDWTDLAMERAYALRRLAQQFSASDENGMRAEDRRTLRAIGREHLTALGSDLDKLQNTITPVVSGIGGAAAAIDTHEPSESWQAESDRVLASARRVESLLAQVIGVTPAAPSNDVPSQLLTALAQLKTDIEHCQRLLSYD
jgi:Putative zinc-finger